MKLGVGKGKAKALRRYTRRYVVPKAKVATEKLRYKGKQESIPFNIGRGARKGYETSASIIKSDIKAARAKRRLKPQFVMGRPKIAEDYGSKNLSHDYSERNLTSGTPWW